MASNRTVIAELKRRVKAAGSQAALAAEWGYNRQYISSLLAGRDQPSEKVLGLLGFESKTVIVRKAAIDAEKQEAYKGEATHSNQL